MKGLGIVSAALALGLALQSPVLAAPAKKAAKACLLYTSDAADERSSVDLGGRRIIKKKKNTAHTDIETNRPAHHINSM